MALELHNHVIDRIAFVNGFVSGIALYPQVWTVVTSGNYEGVSLATFLIVMANSLVWLLYAIHRSLVSLAVASLLNIIAASILVGAVVLG